MCNIYNIFFLFKKYIIKLITMNNLNFKYEDILVINNTTAIINRGSSYIRPTEIGRIKIIFKNFNVILQEESFEKLHEGTYLRLGTLKEDGTLIYSDTNPLNYSIKLNGDCSIKNINEKLQQKINTITGHQPYYYKDDIYYTDLLDNNDMCCIFKNGTPLITSKFTQLNNYNEISNPYIINDILYFECCKRGFPRPAGWEIWSYNLNDKTLNYIIKGANPSVFEKKLIYSEWKVSSFNLKYINI